MNPLSTNYIEKTLKKRRQTMKKMMAVLGLAMGIVGFGLIAEEAKEVKENKEKAIAEMNAEELKAALAKKEAALAAEQDNAKKEALQKEIEEIKNFVEKGKRLLLLLEPGNFPNIKNLLASYGIEIENDIVVDLASRRFLGDALSPLIMNYPYSEITKDFNLACIFSTARSVKIKENLPEKIKGNILAKTSNASWSEKNMKEIERGNVKFDENDESGPVSIAGIIEKEMEEGRKTRIAVFGDSDFVTDKFINFSGNKDFILNTINYLCEEEILISIRSQKEENQPLLLSQKAGKFIFFLPVVIVPVLIIGIGSFITLKRKILY